MISSDNKLPTMDLREGEEFAGFLVERITPVPELRCIACEAKHLKSGAHFLHLLAADDENLFAVAFRTPAWDGTGIPHILEHSVLDGSEKFPVKEPFVEMLKSSMATFINAMTYSDRTVYPVASNVVRDFFNLSDVYFDAVFHPRLTPLTLKQEGHHLEFEDLHDLESPLTVQGIVYNEMKGSYSDLDSAVDRIANQALFPDTPYGFDSGGDPDAIPELTYSQFIKYYETHYTPENAYFLLYGNIPTKEHFTFLNERLEAVEPRGHEQVPQICLQPRWLEPREIVEHYPIAEDDEPARKSAVTLNWIVGHAADDWNELAFEVIDRLLLGNAAAPLRKALIDSHLGEDLTPSGFSGGTLESTFHVGLKGTDRDQKEAICALVLKTLQNICGEGFSREQVDAAFQQLQYSMREIKSSYPLHLMDAVYSVWLYDLDPLTAVRVEDKLNALYQQYLEDNQIFTKVIQERLLENQHRLTAVFVPDPDLQQHKDEIFRKKMAEIKQQMRPDDLRETAVEAEQLKMLQNVPNTPEQLATLPRLSLDDLPRRPKPIPVELIVTKNNVPLLVNKVFANGVNYVLLGFDLEGMDEELLELVPVFASLFNKVGTQHKDYVELAETLAAKSGGFGAGTFLGVDALDAEKDLKYFTVNFKALDATYEDVLKLTLELLHEFDLRDTVRLRDILVQRRVRTQSAIIPNGHRIAAQHAARNLSSLAAMGELWGGLPQIRLNSRLTDEFEVQLDALKNKLERIREFIVTRAAVKVSFTGSDHLVAPTIDFLEKFSKNEMIEPGTRKSAFSTTETSVGPLVEGLAVPSDVAYCALCIKAPHISDPNAPQLQIFSQLLAFDYLWEEVRVKGGAYGGFSSYDNAAGVFELISYRDPHIDRTLKVYRQAEQYVGRMAWNHEQITQAVISCAKGDEKPIRPSWATHASLWRYVARLSEEFRIQYRERLLQVKPDTVRAAALELLHQELPAANICVLADRRKLQQSLEQGQYSFAIENVAP